MSVLGMMLGAASGMGAGAVKAQSTTIDKIQNPSQQPQKSQDPMMPSDDPDMPGDAMRARLHEDSVKALNDSRHKRLEDDVTKLQSLTNELKSDVDKSSKDELSLDVVRKAAEIEKLAHDVQSRMKS